MTKAERIVIVPRPKPKPDPAAVAAAEERIDRAERELKEAIRAWEELVGGPYLALMPGETFGPPGER
jgi:hypothetical protein